MIACVALKLAFSGFQIQRLIWSFVKFQALIISASATVLTIEREYTERWSRSAELSRNRSRDDNQDGGRG